MISIQEAAPCNEKPFLSLLSLSLSTSLLLSRRVVPPPRCRNGPGKSREPGFSLDTGV